MNVIRKLGVTLCAGLLGSVLLLLAWTNIGIATIHNRQVVKSWFDKSDFYNKVGPIAVDTIKQNNARSSGDASSGGSGIPISDPAIQALVTDTLSADFVKTNVDTVLDSTYSWLDGTQKDLYFRLDLTSAKEKLTTGLSNYAKTRAAALPPCGAVNRNDPVDPFAATCLPKGVTADQVATLAKQQFLAQDFFKNTTIKGEDFKIKDKSGESIPITSDSRAVAVQKTYQLSSSLPIILTVLSVILMAGIIFLSRDRLRGIRRVGVIFLTTGLSLVLVYFLAKYLYGWASTKLASQSTSVATQTKLGFDFLGVVLADLERILLTHAVAFSVLGLAAILLASMLIRRNRQENEPQAQEHEPNPQPQVVVSSPSPVQTDVPMFDRPVRNLERPPVPGAPPRPKQPRKLQF